MKKGVFLFGILILVMTFWINFVFAANATQMQDVNRAYQCLEDRIEVEECSELTIGEKTFSLLALGECRSELLEDSKDDICWPSSSCDLKMTAQSLYALNENNYDTSEIEEWILSQKQVPRDLTWYLEIESEKETSCTVTYLGGNNQIEISEDKTISGQPGSCLSYGPGNYWLKIEEECFDEEFEIQCDESFLTTLLFAEKDNPSLIHVLGEYDTHSAPEWGKTVEKINSYCFSTGLSCDYESNLWAAIALNFAGRDVSGLIPYLAVTKERQYFPDPFLYILTGYPEYQENILGQQINKEYWSVSNGRYYDTALAMLPFQGQELDSKTLAEEWLFRIQQTDGCWDAGNIRNNAFILYSFWPRFNPSPIGVDPDDSDETPDNACKESGYFCMIESRCQGETLSDYSCPGSSSCCDTEYVEPSCSEKGGEICESGEYCNGDSVSASDVGYYEICCLDECLVKEEPKESECKINFGVCEVFECEEGYEETNLYSCDFGDICCLPEDKGGEGSIWWIWLLFGLIVIVVVGIIYRDKIKMAFIKMNHKGGPPPGRFQGPPRGPPGMPPRMPPTYNRMPQRGPPPQRRIIPNQNTRPPQRSNSPKELDDVLKKLKDMSR
jgi:hypothetical protein